MIRDRTTAISLGMALAIGATSLVPAMVSADACQTFERPPSTVNPKTLVVCTPEEGITTKRSITAGRAGSRCS